VLRLLALIAIISGVAVVPAAADLEIQFTGVNLVYDGSAIFDAGGAAGGDGDPVTADSLFVMNFIRDGVLVGTLTSDIFLDVLITDVAPIPALGSVTGSDAFFDLLTSASTPGWGLPLEITSYTIFYTGSGIAVVGGGTATVCASGPCVQDLPFGLVIDEPITFSFSLNNLTNVTTGVTGALTGFAGSGTGEVNGAAVPEPSAVLLLGGGLLTVLTLLHRARAAVPARAGVRSTSVAGAAPRR
jgi:hypothetical protein